MPTPAHRPPPPQRPCRPQAAFAASLALAWALPRAGGSDADQQFIDGLETAPGVEVSLFAGRDQAANPVALAIGGSGDVYLAETMRFRIGGVDDLRDHSYFFDDDMQIRSLDDRLAMYQKWAAEKRPLSFFTENSERVKLLRDADGDGRADQASVFADGFDSPLNGTMAGLLVDGADVYVTCIPSLWKLGDTDGDRRADAREELARGFGVRLSLSGHDLHGVVSGPDGRLYFSLGDRGFDLTTREGDRLAAPYEGGVFRCEPDGSGLEVFYHGLRNPQEIAFDDLGRLFTVDNNGDMGDGARVTYLIEGAHTGWHAGWQVHQTFTSQAGMETKKLNPWMEERMWEPYQAGQPAYLTPCVANLTAGPGGLTIDPGEGSGFPDRYRGWFFVCDYTGGPNSGIHAFSLQPSGAGFSLADTHKLVWGVAATDCDFGYDGRLYFSDYIGGWHKEVREEGRIFAASFPAERASPAVSELAALSASDFGSLKAPLLAQLLGHPDRRIRLRAQFALARRGESDALAAVARDPSSARIPRLHGLWGLGQIARSRSGDLRARAIDLFIKVLDGDGDSHLRAQAAVTLGDLGAEEAAGSLVSMLRYEDLHVQAMAAIALGKTGSAEHFQPAVGFVESVSPGDPWLRHAGVMALLGTGSAGDIAALSSHPSAQVRLAAVVALRRLASAALAEFLEDPDPAVAAEAARAVYDLQVPGALEELAAGLVAELDTNTATNPAPLTLHRMVRANFRLGGDGRAALLARFATLPEAPESARLEALECLREWGQPHPVDRVVAKWWPLEPRPLPGPGGPLADSLRAVVFSGAPGAVRAAAARTAHGLGVDLDPARLAAVLGDPAAPDEIRLFALAALGSAPADAATLTRLLDDASAAVRAAALGALAPLDPEAALAAVARAVGRPARPASPELAPTPVRQAALRLAGRLPGPAAAGFLNDQLAQLAAGQYPPELELDLLEAARASAERPVREVLDRYQAHLAGLGPEAAHRFALEGGDPEAGARVFTSHTTAQCTRCHKVQSKGGTAGPDLSGVGQRLDRTALVRSLVDPSAEIAPGFGTVAVTLASGETVAGFQIEDSSGSLALRLPDDGTRRVIPKSEIASRTPQVSSMPPMSTLLTPDELRDLVAYLATLRDVAAEDVVK
jgi:quinoprotein glucose dehydrogenase